MKILADLSDRSGQDNRAPPLSYDRVLGVSIKEILFYRRIIIAWKPAKDLSLSLSLTPLALFSIPFHPHSSQSQVFYDDETDETANFDVFLLPPRTFGTPRTLRRESSAELAA